MNIELLQAFLGWNLIIHIGMLLVVFLFTTLGRNWMLKMHQSMFGLAEGELLKIYFFYIAIYKMLIIIFVLIPYVVLRFLL